DKLLAEAGVEHWLAQVNVKPPRRGGRGNDDRPAYSKLAFPGYVFVRVACCPRAWAGVLSIKGARAIVGDANGPVWVSDKEIIRLQALVEKDHKAIATITKALHRDDEVVV